MEKSQRSNMNNIRRSNSNGTTNKRPIWDCDSTLYDSFELNSFQKHLDSAIISSTRTLSMPRQLPSELLLQHDEKKPVVKSKLSRSLQKLLRSVFRTQRPGNGPKTNISTSSSPGPWFIGHEAHQGDEDYKHGGCFAVYEKDGHGLSTIPEGPEVGSLSPNISSFVRKTRSERFTAASVGIYSV